MRGLRQFSLGLQVQCFTVQVQENAVADRDDGEDGVTQRLDYALDTVGDTPCGMNNVEPVVSGWVRLDACTSMQYEARDDVQGVKFHTDDGEEGWTPIERREAFRGRSSGDGTRSNPTISEAPKLPNLCWAKELSYQVIDGTPGFRFRQGTTHQSYKWIPIISSPIANRTRTRMKTGT